MDALARHAHMVQRIHDKGGVDVIADLADQCDLAVEFGHAYGLIGALSAGVESGEMAFCQTDTGIRFYRPLVINGVEDDSLRYENSVLSSSDGKVFISWNKIIG